MSLSNRCSTSSATRSAEHNRFKTCAAWIARLELAQPTLLVTHQVVISAVAEVPAGDGEIVVMRREADGRLTLQGRQPTA